MKDKIDAIENLSDQLEQLTTTDDWQEVLDIIDQQKKLIAESSKKNNGVEDRRLLLVSSIKRALDLQQTLIAKANCDKEKSGKEAIDLTNRKKMHSAYNRQ